jgi:hypothetical protein
MFGEEFVGAIFDGKQALLKNFLFNELDIRIAHPSSTQESVQSPSHNYIICREHLTIYDGVECTIPTITSTLRAGAPSH